MTSMGNTWVIDIRHYLDDDGQLAVKAGPARKIAEHMCEIVECVTRRPKDDGLIIPALCRRRPGRKPCNGLIQAGYSEADPQTIIWECLFCGDKGSISGWQGTQWHKPPLDEVQT
jgi:hypothetical protein